MKSQTTTISGWNKVLHVDTDHKNIHLNLVSHYTINKNINAVPWNVCYEVILSIISHEIEDRIMWNNMLFGTRNSTW